MTLELPMTPWSANSSTISSLEQDFNSAHRTTPFDWFRVRCGEALTATPAILSSASSFWLYVRLSVSTRTAPLCSRLTFFNVPTDDCRAFCNKNGESLPSGLLGSVPSNTMCLGKVCLFAAVLWRVGAIPFSGWNKGNEGLLFSVRFSVSLFQQSILGILSNKPGGDLDSLRTLLRLNIGLKSEQMSHTEHKGVRSYSSFRSVRIVDKRSISKGSKCIKRLEYVHIQRWCVWVVERNWKWE